MITNRENYDILIAEIGNLLISGRQQAATAVNTILVQTYWLIGQYIVEYEQNGNEKAEYGSLLLDRLLKQSSLRPPLEYDEIKNLHRLAGRAGQGESHAGNLTSQEGWLCK